MVETMLRGSNHGNHVLLNYELGNDYTIGTDNYPTKMENCMRLLNNYKSDKKNHTSDSVNQEEVAFIPDKGRHKSATERKNNITYFKCVKKGQHKN